MLRTCLLFFLIFVWGRLLAQDLDRQRLIDNSALEFLQVAGNQSAIYYGRLQEGHPRTKNQPYLKDDQYVKARLSYHRVIYPEAMLRLDLNRDELIILSPDYRHIVLFPENVDFADMHGLRIINFKRDSLPGCPPAGYYYLLHSGKCKVLEKQTAMLMLDNTHQYYFSVDTKFYLYRNGSYTIIRNKRGLLKTLQPYKKELKRFISAHQLLYRRDAAKFITQTVIEYEKLSGLK